MGTDQKISAVPVWSLSNQLPRRQAACCPSHRPSAIEISAAVPVSSRVGPTLSAISEETDWL